MSAEEAPIDPTEGGNGLSIQNGSANTLVTESETPSSADNGPAKKTSRSGRLLRPSAKAQTLFDDKEARTASKAPSKADRFKRTNLVRQTAQCDFESTESINLHFHVTRARERMISRSVCFLFMVRPMQRQRQRKYVSGASAPIINKCGSLQILRFVGNERSEISTMIRI